MTTGRFFTSQHQGTRRAIPSYTRYLLRQQAQYQLVLRSGMERQLSLRGPPSQAAAAVPARLRRSVRVRALQVQLRHNQFWYTQHSSSVLISLQECVVRRVQARQAAGRAAGGSQTATTGSDTWSSSEDGGSHSEDSDSEASSDSGRGQGGMLVQQQSAGRRQQQVAGASGPHPGAAAAGAAAAGSEGPGPSGVAATPAAAALHALESVDQGPHLRQPYSHFFLSPAQLKLGAKVRIAVPLCTDIKALQSLNGSCPVKVSFMVHPAGWNVNEYVLQHPVQQQQVQQQTARASHSVPASTSTTQVLGPFEGTVKKTTGYPPLYLTGLQSYVADVAGALQLSKSSASPHAVVLQERVRHC